MPRNRRIQIPGAIYHIMTRGIERTEIFRDDADREEFLRRLGDALKDNGSKCYGWAILPNHFHLLVQMGQKPLSEMMRKLLTGYAVYFNRKHRRSGHLYQNRYKSILCDEETYLLELVRYIHLNPLRAGMVKDMTSLNRFPWSGHAVLLRNRKCSWQATDEVLERFGKNRNRAIERYESFVLEAKGAGHRYDLSGGGLRRSAGGWVGVCALRRAKEHWRGDERVLGDGAFVNAVLKASEEQIVHHERLRREGWNLKKLTRYVCDLTSISEDDVFRRSKKSRISQARELIMYWGRTQLNLTGRMLARYFSISSPAVTKSIRRGELLVQQKNLKLNS